MHSSSSDFHSDSTNHILFTFFLTNQLSGFFRRCRFDLQPTAVSSACCHLGWSLQILERSPWGPHRCLRESQAAAAVVCDAAIDEIEIGDVCYHTASDIFDIAVEKYL